MNAWLSESPLDPVGVQRVVSATDRGAVVLFIGTTRDHFEGRQVVELSYEAYAPMAIAEMEAICAQVALRWPGSQCAVAHRIGVVPAGEASVVIAVASPHRAEAYEASRFAIDTLKATVPIWKKEHYTDGSVWKANAPGNTP